MLVEATTHSSGLPGWRPFYERIAAIEATQPGFLGSSAACEAVVEYIAKEELVYERGSRSLYSDLGFMLLGVAVERLSGESLDQFCSEQITSRSVLARWPMRGAYEVGPINTSRCGMYHRSDGERSWRGRILCGEVHDENAYALGGVAGHAGLFGTARAVLAVSQA